MLHISVNDTVNKLPNPNTMKASKIRTLIYLLYTIAPQVL